MSLRLRQAIPGRPRRDSPSALSAITTPKGSYFIYPSSSNVVLLDPEGDLHDTLPFWDALPHRAGPSGSVRDVGGVLARDDLVLAWSGPHVVLWNFGSKGWAVHSTILANAPVASMDFWSGTLALGTQSGVELWRMNPKEEVVVWDRIWTTYTDACPIVALPPEKTHVAWYFPGGRAISIQAFGPKGVTGTPQVLRQPREIEWMAWRTVCTSDAQLYVVARNGVLRIYATVLDDPSWFQLLYAMDYRAFRDSGVLPPKGKGPAEFGHLWIPDGCVLRKAAKDAHAAAGGARLPSGVAKILDALEQDEADIAMWFGPNGEVVLRSILNLDRAPPTLIKSEPLTSFVTDVDAAWSSRGCLLNGKSLFLAFPPSHTQPDVLTLKVSLLDLFAGSDESLENADPVDFEVMSVLMTQDIDRFVRTPNGRGLLAIGEGGEIGVWEKRKLGKMARHESLLKTASLVGKGQWMAPAVPVLYAIYAKGRGIASYYSDPKEGPRVVLQHLDPGSDVPTEPVVMPHFSPKPDGKIELLLALSDIDDGYSARRRRTRRAVIIAVAASGEAWVWRIDPAPTSPRAEFSESPLASTGRRLHDSPNTTPQRRGTLLPDSPAGSPQVRGSMMSSSSGVYHSEKPIVTLISHSTLPVDKGKKPRFILPVDPMGWHSSTIDWETDTPLQDMVVTLSEEGVLEFWTPRLGQHLKGQGRTAVQQDACSDAHSGGWMRTSVVRTEKTNVKLARTSSRKKTALVCDIGDKHEVTIWDSNVSEFSTGLELTRTFDRGHVVQDLDWTTTSDLQSVLAVGFPHQIVLVCEQRMSYVDVTPGWAPFLHVDMRKYTSVPINDSIWIAGGSLAVGAGNQVYIFSRFLVPDSTPSSSAEGTPEEEPDSEEPEDIFQLIAHENGPLFDFHPTMLHQCLMWDKIDLVKSILVTLAKDMRKCEDEGRRRLVYQRLDPLEFHQSNALAPQKTAAKTDYSSLFSIMPTEVVKDDDEFTPELVVDLIERLDGPVVVPLDQYEKSSLAALAQAVLEVEASRRSLDICGLRYLISIRTFANRDRRAALSGAATPMHIPIPEEGLGKPMANSRISFRNIVWATHSESHQVLLQAATAVTENNKMMWEDAKRLGVFLWLRSQESIRDQLEVVARNRFMADEDRDPTSASLFFFALGKKQVVHGLWRQAPGHKEQNLMLKFLANDFTLPRWKTAAAKNAYALLSKQRYEYAAAFFMLAGSPKDAITIALRQLNDWQLAVALARAVEGDGPLLRWILSDTVLPIAFSGGHRWLASWALWMLNRRDLSVRVIVSPMEEVANAWDAAAVKSGKLQVGRPDNDDPSLLLLFQHLKSKTLQTAKGTSEITPVLEFDFVIHNARVFWRMGCHPLGLDVLRSWSFERPWFPPPKRREPPPPITTTGGMEVGKTPRSPISPTVRRASLLTPRRRSSFMLSRPVGRDTMLMDMDVVAEISTEPPTRVPSPSGSTASGKGPSLGDAGLVMSKPTQKEKEQAERDKPNLMKGLKHDVQQGAAVFDMESFFAPSDSAPKIETTAVSSPTSSSGVATPAPGPNSGEAHGGVKFDTDSFGGGVAFGDSFGGGGRLAPHPPSVSPGSPRSPRSGAQSPRGEPDKLLPGQSGQSVLGSKMGSGVNTPRKGANLMKEVNANALSDQGGAEFSFDNFFPATGSAPSAPSAPALARTPSSEKRSSPPPKVDADDEGAKGRGEAQVKTENEAETKVEDKPRKGANLMKDSNAHTQSAQGHTEFSFDSFFPSSEPLPRESETKIPSAPSTPPSASNPVDKSESTEQDLVPVTPVDPSTDKSKEKAEEMAEEKVAAPEEDLPRKGANLMKESNAHTQSAQGHTEFSFDSFPSSEPAPPSSSPLPPLANPTLRVQTPSPRSSPPSAESQPRPDPLHSDQSDSESIEPVTALESPAVSSEGETREGEEETPRASSHGRHNEAQEAQEDSDSLEAVTAPKTPGDSIRRESTNEETNEEGGEKDEKAAPPDEDEPRKGANLMKDLNPNASASQGAADFNMDDFGF